MRFVGSDLKQRQASSNGSKFTVLSVRTQRSWKNAQNEWSSKTEWHRGQRPRRVRRDQAAQSRSLIVSPRYAKRRILPSNWRSVPPGMSFS
ncbi:MAG: hypothetical protein DMG49_06525 [Acidobacteria bacterium]|nr:MAG: hypothetical protein DMG49_06525 [Acidobacteriota bacterium]